MLQCDIMGLQAKRSGTPLPSFPHQIALPYPSYPPFQQTPPTSPTDTSYGHPVIGLAGRRLVSVHVPSRCQRREELTPFSQASCSRRQFAGCIARRCQSGEVGSHVEEGFGDGVDSSDRASTKVYYD